MFQFHNNILCVEGGWLYQEAEVMTFDNYKKLQLRNWLKVIRRGCKGTPALVEFDSMPERFKSEIITKYGDPYKVTKNIQFKDYLNRDLTAVEYFNNYTLDNGKALPEKNIEEYIANATILNAIHNIVTNRKAKRKALGGSTAKVWDKMSEVINELPEHTYPHSLPKNVRRLKDKYTSYKKHGYESLIHKGFCNSNSEKINEDAKIWLLSRWADRVNKVATLHQLLNEYNRRAELQGWKQLKEERTLHLFLNQEDIKHLWYGHRYGELNSKQKFSYRHKTALPSMRDSLWYSDGTKLNYFYQDQNGKIQTCQVYEVIDAYSEVLLGYHVSNSEDYEAQYNAYKMAVQFAQHAPYEIRFDNQGGHAKLESNNFLTRLSKLCIRTQPYNPQSKTIESIFGRFQQHYLKQDWYFSGQNITATKQESKANVEFIQANKKNLPFLSDIIKRYEQRRNEWNEAPHPKTGISRLEMYQTSYNPKAQEVTLWDMVDLFWMLRPTPITVTTSGIAFTEKKTKYEYMVYANNLPDVNWLKRNIDKQLFVRFDPQDMSLIYLYEKYKDGLRFVTQATTKVEIHRGKQEQEEWEASYMAKVDALNKESRIETRNTMDEIQEALGALPEQNGLVSPPLRGMESKRKKRKPLTPDTNKAISNAVVSDLGDDEPNIYEMM
jgi:hypothetical protein